MVWGFEKVVRVGPASFPSFQSLDGDVMAGSARCPQDQSPWRIVARSQSMGRASVFLLGDDGATADRDLLTQMVLLSDQDGRGVNFINTSYLRCGKSEMIQHSEHLFSRLRVWERKKGTAAVGSRNEGYRPRVIMACCQQPPTSACRTNRRVGTAKHW